MAKTCDGDVQGFGRCPTFCSPRSNAAAGPPETFTHSKQCPIGGWQLRQSRQGLKGVLRSDLYFTRPSTRFAAV